MINNALFLFSVFLTTAFAWGFLKLGKGALITWIALSGLLANLFVLKQITIFGLNATASDIFAVSGLFSLNLLQEYFGKSATKEAIWASLTCLIAFTVLSQIHLLYLPSTFDEAHPAYHQIFQHTPRIFFASITTLFIVQQFDSRFYPFLRTKLSHLPMLLTSSLSILISQLLDTALFSLLGLYGLVSALFEIFVMCYSIKVLTILCLPGMAALSKKMIQND